MSNRLGGLQGTAYTGTNADQPPNYVFTDRRPNQYDINYSIGDLWIYRDSTDTVQELWWLASLAGNTNSRGSLAKWVLLSSGAFGSVTALRADDGNLANPDLGIVNTFGDARITTTADNNFTLNINLDGSVPSSFPTNSGTAIPAAGVLNILGAHGINTSGAANTVTVAINNAITLGDLANIAAFNDALTVTTGDISLTATNGVGNINMPRADNTAAQGVLYSGGNALLHANGSGNLFVGLLAGNGFALDPAAINNTCVGSRVGQSITTGNQNTGVGYHVLQDLTTGTDNTAVGYLSCENITTSSLNTALGRATLERLTTGSGHNTAIGDEAANFLIDGAYNCAIGYVAGTNWTGTETSNIAIENVGSTGESNTMRIGTTGSGNGEISRSFIAAIRGVTTDNADAIPVLIDSAGQLGTISSSREVKDNIQDLKNSERIYNLRPVTFNYKNHSKESLNIGLIAEEVESIIPEIVVRRNDGSPLTVKYHELPVILLKEIQHLNERIKKLEKQ